MRLSSLLPLAFLGQAVNALSPAEWRKQSIYFLLTDRFGRTDNSTSATCNTEDRAYCGGTWQGIINHLDYIQGMGFTAIWITPVTGQFYDTTHDGTSYHGYWQQDIYTLNAHLGDANDLQALSAALHARGMYLMVDVVANHMGFHGAGANTDYNVFDAFPSASYFHPYCPISNYDNQTDIEDCWLGDSTVSLPDLNTELDAVRSIWNTWVAGLVANYSIDGLRVDTVKHVEKSFWSGYNDAAGVYCVGEVFDGDPAYTCDYQNYMDGVLNYPMYYPLLAAFQSTAGSISSLYSSIGAVAEHCADPTLLGNFLENHDNPRFASYTSDYALAKNALSFLFLSDGIPIVYAGQEQHYSGGADPANREATWLSGYATSTTASPLYAHIATTNQIRSLAIRQQDDENQGAGWATSANRPFYQDDHTIAMLKGSATAGGSSSSNSQVLTVLSNKGEAGDTYTLSLGSTGYAAGATLVELYTCATVTVDGSGNVPVPMASGEPRVLVPSSWVTGNGLCGGTVGTNPSLTATSTSTTTSSSACASATAVPVLFCAHVTTYYGENVYLAGSVPQLDSWNTDNAVALSSSDYTASNPVWKATVSLPPGMTVSYKFFKKESDGSIVWENDPNRSYTVPTGCSGLSATVTGTWK